MSSKSTIYLSRYLCGLAVIGMTVLACKKSTNFEENETKSEHEEKGIDPFEEEQFDPTILTNLENYCSEISSDERQSNFSICNPEIITSLNSQPIQPDAGSSFALGVVEKYQSIENLGKAIVRLWESRNAIGKVPAAVRHWIQIIFRGKSIEIPVRYRPTPEQAKKYYDGFIATRNKLTEELKNIGWKSNWDWMRGRYYLALKDPSTGKPMRVLVKGGFQSIEADCTGKGCQKIAEALANHFSKGQHSSLPNVFTGQAGHARSWNHPEIQLKGSDLWLNQNFYNAPDYRYKSKIEGNTRIRLSIGRQNALHPNSPNGSPNRFLEGLRDALMTPEIL